MSTSARQSIEPADAVAIDVLGPAAQVARDLAIRVQVVVARLPGIVDEARLLAASLGLAVAIEIDANGICIQLSPRSTTTARGAYSETRQDSMHGLDHRSY